MGDLRQRLLAAFEREKADHIVSMRELLASPQPDREELQRRAHTLKGAAAAVGWPAGARLADCLENAFLPTDSDLTLPLLQHSLDQLERTDSDLTEVLESWRTPEVPLPANAELCWEVWAGNDAYWLPGSQVEQILQVAASSLHLWRGWPRLLHEGRRITALALTLLLDLPASTLPRARWPALLLRYRGRRLLLLLEQPPRRLRGPAAGVPLSSARLLQAYRSGRVLAPALKAYPHRRILVVDDSPTTRALQREILESNGYRVLLAEDGLEALQILALEPVDLILTDLQMPRLDGFGLLEHLQADPALAAIPVALVSSLGPPANLLGHAFLNKRTFTQAELLRTVAQLLECEGAGAGPPETAPS